MQKIQGSKVIRQLCLGLGLLATQAGAKAASPVVNHGTIVNVNTAPDEAAAIRALDAAVMPQEPVLAPRTAPAAVRLVDPHERGLSFGGPRFGISYSSGEGYDKLKAEVAKTKPDVKVEQTMSQFGWQIEYRMFRTDEGLTALTEFIPLIGGMDQGLALPSVTWLVGLRGANGFEVGVGPNIGLSGVAMMLGMGFTFNVGGINIPFNIAYGRGANQTSSAAISTGFNL